MNLLRLIHHVPLRSSEMKDLHQLFREYGRNGYFAGNDDVAIEGNEEFLARFYDVVRPAFERYDANTAWVAEERGKLEQLAQDYDSHD